MFHLLKLLELNRYAGGAAQPLLTQTVLKGIKFLLPPNNIRKYFNAITSEFFCQCNTLLQMEKKVAQARDLILPRLMNGEIVV